MEEEIKNLQQQYDECLIIKEKILKNIKLNKENLENSDEAKKKIIQSLIDSFRVKKEENDKKISNISEILRIKKNALIEFQSKKEKEERRRKEEEERKRKEKEKERLEKERLEKEKKYALEKAKKLEKERLEKERLEKEEKERLEKEEKERLEKEKEEKEKEKEKKERLKPTTYNTFFFKETLDCDGKRLCILFVLDILHDFFKFSENKNKFKFSVLCDLIEIHYEIFYGIIPKNEKERFLKEKEEVKEQLKEICTNKNVTCESDELCFPEKYENYVDENNNEDLKKAFFYYDTNCKNDQIISHVQFWENKKERDEFNEINKNDKNYKISEKNKELRKKDNFALPIIITLNKKFVFGYNIQYNNIACIFNIENNNTDIINKGSTYSMSCDYFLTKNYLKNLNIFENFLEEIDFQKKVKLPSNFRSSFYNGSKNLKEKVEILLMDFSEYLVNYKENKQKEIKNAIRFLYKRIFFVKFSKDFSQCCAALSYKKKLELEEGTSVNVVLRTNDKLLRALAKEVFNLPAVKCELI